MKDKVNNFFKSDFMMILSYIIIIVGSIYNFARNLIIRKEVFPLNTALIIAAILYSTVLLVTYKSHDKNIMKPAIGMLMGAVVIYSLNVFFENIFDAEVRVSYFTTGFTGFVSLVLDFLQCALFFVFSTLHLAMNKTHESSPKIVHTNQIIVILLFVVYILQVIICIPLFVTFERVFYYVMFYLMLGNITLLIVNVESKIDNFRAIREEQQ